MKFGRLKFFLLLFALLGLQTTALAHVDVSASSTETSAINNNICPLCDVLGLLSHSSPIKSFKIILFINLQVRPALSGFVIAKFRLFTIQKCRGPPLHHFS